MAWSDPDSGVSIDERYLTVEGLKKTLGMDSTGYADNDIALAIDAASDGLEEEYGTVWAAGTDGEVRYYTPELDTVDLGDVLSVSEIATIRSSFIGGSTYTALDPDAYTLLPIRNGARTGGGNGKPYVKLELARGQAQFDPCRNSVRITGRFGWDAVPAGVRVAVTIIATRILKRTREAPFGVVLLGTEGTAMYVRQIVSDPEIQFAMKGASGGTTPLIV